MTYETPVGANMFAYCGNNPIVSVDYNGEAWETIWDAISLAAGVAEVASNPYDPWGWISLAGDMADLLIPFVGGIGETTRALKIASNAVELTGEAKRGWRVGEDITNLTRAGNIPSWSTMKSRYWKNKEYYFGNEYSRRNRDLMRQGKAPLVEEGGKLVPMELHHFLRRQGNNFYLFFEVTPMQHAAIDPFRHVK